MKKSKMILLSGVISLLSICGCGVVSEEVDGETPIEGQKGYYLDSNVSGLQYTIDGCTDGDTSCSGYTLSDGSFPIQEDKGVTFHIAGMKIDYVSSKYLVDGAIITAPSNPKLLSFLQSLDSDGDASNGIKIDQKSIDTLKTLNISSYSGVDDSSFIVSDIITKVKAKVDSNGTSGIKLKYIDESNAFVHYEDTMSKYQPHTSTTVQSALDKLTTLLDNIDSYDESSIASEISAIKTMVDGNHTLSGDRGIQDLAIAQALIELSELTNQEYISDTFEFKNSGVPNLSHFVKDMTFTGGASMGENNFHPFESLTTGVIQYKDENSTNLVANADKMSQQTATKLKSISDKLAKALAKMPRNYTFTYNGSNLTIDKFQALRASLLAMASKLSFMSAYAKGDDSYYKTQVYTEGGNSYEYAKMEIYSEDFWNDPKVGLATDQTQLGNAKTYLLESSRLLKDLDAIGLDENHTSAMQTNIDYASSLYKILKSGSGIWELKDVNSSDSVSIDVNRLYNTSTAIKVSDFGTSWKDECPINYTLAPLADRIKSKAGVHTLSYCIKTSNSTDDYNYRKDNDTHMKPSTKPTTSTSGLDDIITKIVTGGVTKTGQEILDHYTLDDSSNNDNIVWAKIINIFTSANNSPVMDITTDSSGNVFVAGRTNSSFDGQTNQGNDGFVTKYSTAGVKLWTRFVGGTNDDGLEAISTDSSGNVFVAGYTNSSFDGESNQGSSDGFVTKFNTNGDKLWTKFIGGSSYEQVYDIRIDSNGNIFVGGQTHSSFFDEETNEGMIDGFLTKFDTNGAKLWTKFVGGSNNDNMGGVRIDSTGNVFFAGDTYSSFDGQTNQGGSDGVFCKFDTNGNKLWTKFIGSTGYDEPNGLEIDSNGNMFVSGYLNNAQSLLKLDPNGSIVASSSYGYVSDMLLKDGYLYVVDASEFKKLNTSDLSTVKVFNNAYYGNMLTVDGSGNIFTAGVGYDNTNGQELNFIMKVTQ